MNNFLINVPLLMGAPEGGSASSSGQLTTTFITFGLIIVVFYFFIIRPNSKKQKETKKMLSSMKKGDKVASIGGIRGTIVSLGENTVVIKVDSNTKIEFSKTAVATVLARADEKQETPKIEE